MATRTSLLVAELDKTLSARFLAVAGVEFLEVLGQGSQATVYRGIWQDTQVAVKVLRPETSNHAAAAEAKRRFRRECATLARIDHPSLPHVLDSGEVDGRSFLIMEYIAGQSLAQLIAKAPIPEATLVQLATLLADGLHEVHSRELVHRDLKPENILVRETGGAALVDFGLAAGAVRDAARSTDRVAGTLRYAAPEQTGMLKRPVDHRADLYGLGAVLFEALTGRPPFESSDVAELVRMHAVAPPPPLRSLLPSVSPGVEAIVHKLLAKDPDDRYRSARGLARDLRRLRAIDLAFARSEPPHLDGNRSTLHDDGPMIGRSAELGLLRERIAATRKQRGSMLMLVGESGVGKTRLVRNLLRAESDTMLTVIQGTASEGAVPFAALRNALDRMLDAVAASPHVDTFTASIRDAAGGSAPLLKRLSPRMGDFFADVADLPDDAPITDGFLEAIANFLLNIARGAGPTILILEQAQWLDDRSLQVLRHLARELPHVPLVVLCLCRPAANLLPRLPITQIDIAGLDEPALAQLAGSFLGSSAVPAELTRQLAVRSGGNPLTAKEHLRAMIDGGALRFGTGAWQLDTARAISLELPTNLTELLATRLATLSEPTKRALAIAALLGKRFSAEQLGTIYGSGDQLDAALYDARDELIIEPFGDKYSFVHDSLRQLLANTLQPDQRARWHAAIARQLAGQRQEDPYELAHHFAAAGSHVEANAAFAACAKAARTAHDAFGYQAAYELCVSASEIAKRSSIVVDATFHHLFADACVRIGKIDQAVEQLERGLTSSQDPEQRASMHITRATINLGRLDVAQTFQDVHKAAAELGLTIPRCTKATLVGAMLKYKAAQVTQKPVTDDNVRKRALLRSSIYRTAVIASWFGVDPIAYVTFSFECNRALLGIEPTSELIFGRSILCMVAGARGQREAGLQQLAELQALAQQVGDPVSKARAHMYRGHTLHPLGDTVEAQQVFSEGFAHYGPYMENAEFLTGCADAAWNCLMRGHTSEGLAHIERGLARAELTPSPTKLTLGHTYRLYAGPLYAVAGDPQKGRSHLEDFRSQTGLLATDRWRWGQYLSHTALFLAEQRDLGEAFEKTLADFRAIGMRLDEVPLQLRQIYIAEGYARMWQLASATQAARGEAAKRLQTAIERMDALRPHSTVQSHQLVLLAAYHRLTGQAAQAEDFRRRAQHLADIHDNVWVAFEVHCENARALLAAGHKPAASRAAQAASELAARFEWPVRQRRLRDEFGLDASKSSASTPRTPQSPAAHSDQLNLQRHLAALLRLAQASSKALDSQAHARGVLDELVRTLGAERGFLFLVEPPRNGNNDDSHGLKLEAARSAQGADLPSDQGYSQTLVAIVQRTREPRLLSTAEDGTELTSGSIVQHGLRSAIAAPLIFSNKLLGVVYLDSRLARSVFDEHDIEVLQALASHIAVAIETTRAVQLDAMLTAERQRRELAEQLRAFSATMNASLQVDDVANQLLASAKALVPHDRGIVLVAEGEGAVEDLRVAASYGDGQPAPGVVWSLVTQPALAQAFTKSGVAMVCGPSLVTKHYGGRDDMGSWLTVPLHANGNLIGLLGLDRLLPTPFSAADAEIVGIFAHQGAIALANASVFGQVQWRAATDALTGVATRGQMFLLAEQMLKRLRRVGGPLSVIMVDIDHFKKINDTYGHQGGDVVIRGVAQRIRAALRDVDIVGRFGGEEFCVVLPETNLEGAKVVAERIRLAIANEPFTFEASAMAATASLGLATTEGPPAELEALIGTADQALYAAKAAGRNCVRY